MKNLLYSKLHEFANLVLCGWWRERKCEEGNITVG